MHIALLVILASIALAVTHNIGQRSKLFISRMQYKPEILNRTIIVPIRGCQACDEIMMTERIFRSATYPARVIVALPYGGWSQRREALKRASIGWHHNVRFVGDGATYGADFAEDETYMCLVSAGTHMNKNWDEIAVRQFESLENGRAILTSAVRTSASFLCLGDVRPSNFAVESRLLQIPDVLAKRTPIASLFFSCAFAFARKAALAHCVPSAMAQDAGFSIMLWTRGFDFFAPTEHAAQPSPYTAKEVDDFAHVPAFTGRIPAIGRSRTPRAYARFSGVNARTGESAVRAYCGLTRGASASEQVIKFGSIDKAMHAMEQVRLDRGLKTG